MKTKILVTSVALLGVLATGQTIHAEESVTGSDNGQGATSYGSLELTPDSESSTDPLLPSIPDGGTGNIGELTIDNVSPFIFGKHNLTGKKSTVYSTTTNANVQVTDKRGTGAGWTLTVKNSEFVDVEDELNILKGAQVSIPEGTVSSDVGNSSEKPTANHVSLNTSDTTIFKADAKGGLGSWVDKFDGTEDESKVSMEIPAGSMKGSYVSTITWTLADAPQ